MGYLLKLVYFTVVLGTVINSSEALSNAFTGTEMMSQQQLQQMVNEDPIKLNANAFSTTQGGTWTNHSSTAAVCTMFQGMTQESLNDGYIAAARGVNFYHGLVKQAATNTGYKNC